jgi:hypothetical protein
VLEGADFETERVFLPGLADELIGCHTAKSLEPFGEVVSHEEGLQVLFELLMGLVVVALDGGFFKSAVHPLNLPVGPGMLRPGAAVFDGILLAGIGESMNPLVHTDGGTEYRSTFSFRIPTTLPTALLLPAPMSVLQRIP